MAQNKTTITKKLVTVKFGALILKVLLALIAITYVLQQPKVLTFLAENLKMEADNIETIRYYSDVAYPSLISAFFMWVTFMSLGSIVFAVLFGTVGITAGIIAFKKLK